MTDTGRIDRVKDLYTTFNPEVDLEALKKGGFFRGFKRDDGAGADGFGRPFPGGAGLLGQAGMVKEFHGRDKPMSWSEYEMKTGYHWREPEGGAPQNRTKGWNALCGVGLCPRK